MRLADIPVVHLDVASDAEADALYEVRKKIQPRAVDGYFARWRWAFVWMTQIVFYGLAWLPWNGRQAVLFDLGARKFYILGYVFWPQDFIYLTALLIISAYSLFLFTTVGGRLWCGYACPQTVYTEIFMWIERVIEGDRTKRLQLDAAPLSARKLGLRSAKHAIWIALALWTGFTFVGYFMPIRDLLHDIVALDVGAWALFWLLFYAIATYGNAGWMREQVCKYMCPYARFQGVMFDQDTMIVTYDAARGEQRGGRGRKTDARAQGLGDCVDCTLCVQVCPTGIDIRNGMQYECIGCAACIDVCDQVMDKMGYARGLIRYSTSNALAKGWNRLRMWQRVLRPRVLIYTAVLWLIIAGTVVSLYLRMPLKVDVLRDRASLMREVEDDQLENVYRLQIMNTQEVGHRYRISVMGIESLVVAGADEIDLPPATTRQVPVRLRMHKAFADKGSHRIYIQVQAIDDPSVTAVEDSVFLIR
ncbi:MAG TPA: cytochrome c oxidase accessory protein CcoG [Burkholderiales bacterium]|nr:cytochrome c oxidase accessory protein CcoG [Burkholderiales bacterium]